MVFRYTQIPGLYALEMEELPICSTMAMPRPLQKPAILKALASHDLSI